MQASFFLSFSADTSHTFFQLIAQVYFSSQSFFILYFRSKGENMVEQFSDTHQPSLELSYMEGRNMRKINKHIARAKNIDNDNGKVKEIRGCGENFEYDDAEVECFSV